MWQIQVLLFETFWTFFQIFSISHWFNPQMWNPQIGRAYYTLLIGTPEENLMAFILLPQIYSYSDLKIEVVFYMSARIHCFRDLFK